VGAVFNSLGREGYLQARAAAKMVWLDILHAGANPVAHRF
jgi:hypothetical protein